MNPQVIERIVSQWLQQQLAGTSFASLMQPVEQAIADSGRQMVGSMSRIAAEALNQLDGTLEDFGDGLADLASQHLEASSADASGGQKRGTSGILDFLKNDFTRTLITVIAPLTTFATLLAQSTSGFTLFLGAINILALTIAPVIIPFFIVLGAALLALSSMLEDELDPALDALYEWVAVTAVDAFRALVEWVSKVREGLKAMWSHLEPEHGAKDVAAAEQAIEENIPEGVAGAIMAIFDPILQAINPNTKPFWERPENKQLDQQIQDNIDAMNAGGGEFGADPPLPEGIGAGGDWDAKAVADMNKRDRAKADAEYLRGIKDMVREFQVQNLPQASITGIVQASRAAQVAALNASPMDARRLQIIQNISSKLDKMIEVTEKKQKEGMRE